jgi:hypothetical protein
VAFVEIAECDNCGDVLTERWNFDWEDVADEWQSPTEVLCRDCRLGYDESFEEDCY